MQEIKCAVDGCEQTATENVVHESDRGETIKIRTCQDHIGTVGFGLETADNAPEVN
jgi:hypothetical protein